MHIMLIHVQVNTELESIAISTVRSYSVLVFVLVLQDTGNVQH